MKNNDSEKQEYIICNIGKGNYVIAPLCKYTNNTIGFVSTIRIQSLSGNISSINRIFKFKGKEVMPSYDGCVMQFAPPISTTLFEKFVDSINDFEFNFMELDIIKVTFFKN